MRIRTKSDLQTELDNDLAWRKKELTDLKFIVDSVGVSSTRKNVIIRSGIAVLYAHWEGYIKRSSRAYLEFLSMQRLRNNQLPDHFLALSMKSSINFSKYSKKTSEFDKIIKFINDKMTSHATIPYKTAIDTESNLSSKVFKEIIWCLGLDYSPYETKEKFIDSTLLNKRNHIAHGEYLLINFDDFLQIRDSTLSILNIFRNQIENEVSLDTFLI